MEKFDDYVLDPYWTRAQCGLKRGVKHITLATYSSMKVNIAYCNRVAAFLQLHIGRVYIWQGLLGTFHLFWGSCLCSNRNRSQNLRQPRILIPFQASRTVSPFSPQPNIKQLESLRYKRPLYSDLSSWSVFCSQAHARALEAIPHL